MKSATKSGSLNTSPLTTRLSPARLPSVGQLILRDGSGRAVEQWILKQSKNTLGSGSNCSLKSDLPGLAPLHVLIVNGSRQCFVRALAPGLTQDGIPVNELLLTGPESHFELAGHRFELLRGEQDHAPVPTSQSRTDRMRFALARPLTLSKPEAKELHWDSRGQGSIVDAPWVSNLIRRTIEPLEAQIESLLMPLAELQAQATQAQLSSSLVVEQAYETAEQKLSDEISALVARQSATMESLSERLRDVNQQLTTIERIIAEDSNTQAQPSPQLDEISVQRSAIEQLQSGMVTVTESLGQLHDRQQTIQSEQVNWKSEIQQQLDQFSQLVEQMNTRFSDRLESDSCVLEAVQALQTSQQHAQEEIQRWQYSVQQQLEDLEVHLQNASIQVTKPIEASPLADTEAVEPTSLQQELIGPETVAFDSMRTSTDDLPVPRGEQPEGQSYQHQDFSIQTSDPWVGSQDSADVWQFESASTPEWVEATADTSQSPHESAQQAIPSWNHPAPLQGAELTSEEQVTACSDEDWTWRQETRSPTEQTSWVDTPEPLAESRNSLESSDVMFSSRAISVDQARRSTELSELFFDGVGTAQLDDQPVAGFQESANAISALDFNSQLTEADWSGSSEAGSEQKQALPSWWSDDETKIRQTNGFGAIPPDAASETDAQEHLSQVPEEHGTTGNPQRQEALIEQADLLQSLRDGLEADEPEMAPPYNSQYDHQRHSPEFHTSTSRFENQQTEHLESQVLDGSHAEHEDSVEEYMTRLLARMRGEAQAPTAVAVSPAQATPKLTTPQLLAEPESAEDFEPLSAENFISRSNAPEKIKNISAFRELANSSARTAIHKSSRQRYLSTGLYKLAICVIGLTVAAVLLAINGLAMNIGLVATLASLLVALIWGYDGIMTFKPLLRSGFVLPPPATDESEEELADQAELAE